MAAPRLYAVVVGGLVVAKRAAGARPDGTYPDPLEEWVGVSEADYRRIAPGWRRLTDGTFAPPPPNGDASDPVRPDTPGEHLWRKEGLIRAEIADLKRRVQVLEDGR